MHHKYSQEKNEKKKGKKEEATETKQEYVHRVHHELAG